MSNLARTTAFGKCTFVVALILSGCGGGSQSPPSPTPQPPPPPANHAPDITVLTVTPSSGVQELTQFTAHAASTDSDGDAVTLSWTILGKPMTGPDQAFTAP